MITLTKASPVRYHWIEPFTGTMTPQGMTPVTVDQGRDFLPLYGWLVAGPLEQIDVVLGGAVLVLDFEDGEYHSPAPEWVAEATGGCECGNPFTLCHPEA